MAKRREPEKISGITDMVEFLQAHMELNETVVNLKECIEKASKLKLKDLSAIDDYLREKKKRRTTQDKIDYLYNVDPNSFDEDLVKLGVRTMRDVHSVIDALRKMDSIANDFAEDIRESSVLDRFLTSLPAAVQAMESNAMLPTTLQFSPAEFNRLAAQLQSIQLEVRQVDQIVQSFASSASPGLANQLVQQLNAVNVPLSKVHWELAQLNVHLPISQVNQISRSLEQVRSIFQPLSTAATSVSQSIAAAAKPINDSYEQLNAISTSLASVQQQIAQLKPFAVHDDRICSSKGSNVYHRWICPYVQRVDLANVIFFNSAKEAQETGRSRCKLCKPP
jgi:hypothetical protein